MDSEDLLKNLPFVTLMENLSINKRNNGNQLKCINYV